MENSHLTGNEPAQRSLLLDLDLRRKLPPFDWVRHWKEFSYFETDGFVVLVKAISRGNKSLENQILCEWGIQPREV